MISQVAEVIMVNEAAADSLPMTCRGGERCCSKEEGRLCGEGEGDCDTDDQVNTGLSLVHTCHVT